jgi:AraC-like DNA-binding protein/quercetin dioxygenase-like cupin family protein
MDWISRLNRAPGRVPLGEGANADVRHWSYSPHLPDNVPHRHTYHEVCLVGGYGAGRYTVEGAPHSLLPGTLFFARPGILHQIVNTSDTLMELSWVTFSLHPEGNSEAASLLRAFAQAETVLVIPSASTSVAANWEALRLAADGPSRPGQDIQIAGLTASLLLGIAQAGIDQRAETGDRPEADGTDLQPARLAVRHIHDNLSQPLAIGEIAAKVGVSPRHLARLFGRLTGVSPAAYIETARLERARTLLRRTDDPIKQVAAHCGYMDIHHFTRVFARRYGFPPGAYRRNTPDVSHPPAEGELV